jgi:hypothetical protein
MAHAAARLQKPVVMLEYIGENHGLAKRANQKDHTVRMKESDHFLMGKPMPKWYEEGVQRLQMDDHEDATAANKTAGNSGSSECGGKGKAGRK